MQAEKKYEFRNFLNRVHAPGIRDKSVQAAADETEIKDGWRIVVGRGCSDLAVRAAKDLQDYLFTSMGVSASIKKDVVISKFSDSEKNLIMLGGREDFSKLATGLKIPRSYRLSVREGNISICGFDDRGVAQGCYYVEDLMNIREAPILKISEEKREPLFSPRMTHSGWGIDQFPDAHLSSIAHAGFDSILVFTKDVDRTTAGYLDFNDLVRRAASFGIDVYLYSYLKSLKHPEEKDAREYYRNTYGRVFKSCPGAKGVILVGESCEFPSKDTVNTTGRLRGSPDDGASSAKPSPGWWPCYDYPQWLEMIKDSVREYSPRAEIVFWTYNWGYAPEKDRVALVESLPDDITLLVTFEMFEQLQKDNIVLTAADYTIAFAGPGKYFTSEAAAARKKNIRLYTMCNTAGMTWDFGVVPYIPVPQQWSRRHAAVHGAREKYGLSGLMESHHYGFYPSIISELAKWSYWSSDVEHGDILKKLAERDFGKEAAPGAIKCWECWSDAVRDHYPVTNEDQYGPLRVGPSYPLIFHCDITRTFAPQEIAFPASPNAHMGGKIVKTFYHPLENIQQSPGALRFPVEIKMLEKMLKLWGKGLGFLEEALESVPARKKDSAFRMLMLGKFIENSIITAANLKRWYLLNKKLLIEKNKSSALKLLEQIEEIARDEIRNAQNTIPVVEADSRLGWEPSMEYVTDREHLDWKIRQVQGVLEEINVYRHKLTL